MRADDKTKEQLREEISVLQGRLAALEASALEAELLEGHRNDGLHFLQTLIDTIPSPIYYKDTRQLYLGCNKAFETFLGLSKDQIVGKTVYDVAPKELADTYIKMDRDLFSKRGTQTYEASVKYADGSRHEVMFNKAAFLDDQGHLAGLVGVMLDITERKRAEEALRKAHDELEIRVKARTAELAAANKELQMEIAERKKAEERSAQQAEFLKHVLESLTHPFYVLDANDYTIKMANPAAAPDGIASSPTCYALTHRRDRACDGSHHVCPLHAIKETGKPFTTEHVHYDRDGAARNVEVHGYPIFDAEGNVAQIIEYTLDITDRKKMEEELRSTAERIKLFAYSVSHDLKSPLIGINGLVRLLHKQYRHLLDERAQGYCDKILKASEQVLMLIEEINLYIRTKENRFHYEKIDSGEVLRTVKDEFGALLSTRQVRWIEPEVLPEIKADKVNLLRVFRNLVDNALKYGGNGLGEIRIGYGEIEEHHVFSVADDGVGIPQEHMEKIFGTFQRTETSRGIEGTGLGLAIVKEIVERHRGTVWAEPRRDRGITFHFSIAKDL